MHSRLQSQTTPSSFVREYSTPSADEETKEPTPAMKSKILESISAMNSSNQKLDEPLFNKMIDSFPLGKNKLYFLQSILDKQNIHLLNDTTATHNAMLDKCCIFGWREEAEILFQRLKDFGIQSYYSP